MKRKIAALVMSAGLVSLMAPDANANPKGPYSTLYEHSSTPEYRLERMFKHLESISFAMADSALSELSVYTIMISMHKYSPNYGEQIAKEAQIFAGPILDRYEYIDNQKRASYIEPFKQSVYKRCKAGEWKVVPLWRDKQ